MGVGRFLASQLRKPSGLSGRIIARILNRGNAPMNDLTVNVLQLTPDDQVLEVGFGGGDLIKRMIPLMPRGRIVGVDFSPEMTAMCSKRFGALVRAGRIELQNSIFAEPVAKFVTLVKAEPALLVLAAGEVLHERHPEGIVCIEHDRRGAL